MSFEPNAKQQEVIDHRDGSLLVAAAAGSGKTATLIAHVLHRLQESDPARRGDLRRMIIVTFTNAAASEMRAKLIRELNLALEQSADPAWLRLQSEIVQQAHICTVDSLCGYLVRNYFIFADLSPDVRIADKAELKMLKQDVLDELMEEKYAEGTDADFFRLISCYSSEKSDEDVRKLVLRLYDTAQDALFPDDWLAEAEKPQPEDREAFWQQEWIKALGKRIRGQLAGAADTIDACIRRAERSEAPMRDAFLGMLQSDRSIVESLLAEDFSGLLQRLQQDPGWEDKPKVYKNKSTAEDFALNDVIAAERDIYKGLIRNKLAPALGRSPERHFELVRMADAAKKALLGLTRAFSEKYKEELKNRNIADFIDIEHYALSLLIEKADDGSIRRTDLAKQLSADFDEIIIDEYQDINNVQDELLRALSREDDGRPNLFLVGDVKQSIYRFRRANPGIFLDKYKCFAAEEGGAHRKIDLSVNYRSRGEILEGINDIFRRVMDEPLGGIAYNKDAELNRGADYKGPGHAPEVLPVDASGSAGDNRVCEAQRIGRKIRELLETGSLRDEKSPSGFRKVQLKDIRILMRALTSARDYAETLNAMGIPAVTPMKRGFYDTQEVQTVLALLKVIDNPRQDIPLAAVLTSPFGGIDDSLLADAAAFAGGGTGPAADLYDRLTAARDGDPGRFARIGAFLDRLDRWRDLSEISSIPELIHSLMAETGYDLYLRAMPGGMARLANLELLLDKAEAFETTSYRGLYQFNRYIERARKSTDEDEAASVDEENVVHIDTIHSSKGLQYPVVFLANASGSFQMDDAQGVMLIHETEGVALESRDASTRQKLKNLKWEAAADRIILETKAEELRLLYVALTRAEEYLYITGAVKDPARWRDAWPVCEDAAPGPLPAHLIRQASSFMDWILMSAAAGAPHLKISPDTQESAAEDAAAGFRAALSLEQLRQRMEAIRNDPPEIGEALDKRVHFRYPYEALAGVRGIYTVSALKQKAQEDMQAEGQEEQPEELPSVRKESEAAPRYEAAGRSMVTGAERGTVYHKIMEHLKIAKLTDEASVDVQIAGMKDRGLLTEEEAAAVPAAEILAFFETPLGARVRRADAEGKLFREQPFILGVPLSEIDPAHADSSERVLVQGIIDLYFEEDGKLILADYKTDRVAEMSELEARYRTQLEYYRRALEQASGKTVAETLIYSTVLRDCRNIS